ncbi:MAG: CotH kinase family protein, partial [Cellulosilyticaceae bacterium]
MGNKHIDKIILAIVTVMILAILGVMMVIKPDDQLGMVMGYEEMLFNTDEIGSVNIMMSSEKWEELLSNATEEKYIPCDVEINGERLQNIGIRAKGNSSLTTVAMSGSNRHSFKLEFDTYIKGQNYAGLDKLVLNNSFSDATMMKEAVTYDMFAYLGADASLYNYAKVMVNGNYIGIYLAVEAVEESFAMRHYGINYGKLYKPDTMEMAQIGDKFGFDFKDMTGAMGGDTDVDFNVLFNSVTEEQFELMKHMLSGSEESVGSGESPVTALAYVDDRLSTYNAIWESSIFESSKEDHRRVFNAIKHINEGALLEAYMDVDNMLRYMAVHTFVVNMDSVTS